MDNIKLVLISIGLVFWISQLIAVAFTDGRFLKSPLHKLTWFLVVLIGNVIGAATFLVWKRQKASAIAEKMRESESQMVAKAFISTKTAEPTPAGDAGNQRA